MDVAKIITDAHGMILLYIGELGEIRNDVSHIVVIVACNLLLRSDLRILGARGFQQRDKGAKDDG